MLEAGNNAFAPRLPVHDLALVIAHPAGGGKKRTKEEAAMGQLTFPDLSLSARHFAAPRKSSRAQLTAEQHALPTTCKRLVLL